MHYVDKMNVWDIMLLWFGFYVLIPHSWIRQRGAGLGAAGRPVENLQ